VTFLSKNKLSPPGPSTLQRTRREVGETPYLPSLSRLQLLLIEGSEQLVIFSAGLKLSMSPIGCLKVKYAS
jgi:hypothetical protein